MPVKPKPFDTWLDRQLRAMFGAVAEQPLPPTLLRLMEQAESRSHILARTDELLARGHEAVRRQRRLVDRLAAGGHDTALADALLARLLETVDSMKVHRHTMRKTHLGYGR